MKVEFEPGKKILITMENSGLSRDEWQILIISMIVLVAILGVIIWTRIKK